MKGTETERDMREGEKRDRARDGSGARKKERDRKTQRERDGLGQERERHRGGAQELKETENLEREQHALHKRKEDPGKRDWEESTGSQRWTTMRKKAHRMEMAQIDQWGREEPRDRDTMRGQHRGDDKVWKGRAMLWLEASLGWGQMQDSCAGWHLMVGTPHSQPGPSGAFLSPMAGVTWGGLGTGAWLRRQVDPISALPNLCCVCLGTLFNFWSLGFLI